MAAHKRNEKIRSYRKKTGYIKSLAGRVGNDAWILKKLKMKKQKKK